MSCVICYDNIINTVFVPCGHRACCIDCSKAIINECPICQLPANCYQTYLVVHSDNEDEDTIENEIKKEQSKPILKPLTTDDVRNYYRLFNQNPQNQKNLNNAIKFLCGKVRHHFLTDKDEIKEGQSIRYFMLKKNGNVQLSREHIIEKIENNEISIDGKKDKINRLHKIALRIC